MEPQVFTVSAFLDHINELLREECAIVAGEITDFSLHQTGAYFCLKDEEGAILNCYLNPYAYRQLGVQLENGQSVKVKGWADIYKPRGKFSFRVQSLELAGEGTLRRAYEALKKQLEEEGLFAQKRPLPQFIERIGVITSKTGAAIDDFRKNLEPLGIKVFLYDTRVEGAKAVSGICEGVRYLNSATLSLDVVVVIRGGGSLEDLQAFNNERVARAIYASKIPTICGIGHDRDVPIASLVADHETSTPSIAAMLVNTSWSSLKTGLPLLSAELVHGLESLLVKRRAMLSGAGSVLTNALSGMFRSYRESVGHLVRAAGNAIMRTGRKIEEYERFLAAVNPERNLRLGYSIIFDDSGRVLKDASKVSRGDKIRAKVGKGEVGAVVEEVLIKPADKSKNS
ncbi:MAG: exodeoxyribonuclease VII large subunit [Candidatus Liptonbacteria bacterium]